jgi:hypothetical protein
MSRPVRLSAGIRQLEATMSDAESVWARKTDDELTAAAQHLEDYTEDGERVIRAELERRGLAAPPATARTAFSGEASPVVRRYRDAYRVGAALVAFGQAIKVVGVILGAIVVVLAISLGGGPFDDRSLLLSGIFFAAIVGGLFWILGVAVAALGQILRATLDSAVSLSRFLSDAECAEAMGLPGQTAARPIP